MKLIKRRPLDPDEVRRFERIAKTYRLTVQDCWDLYRDWQDALTAIVDRDMGQPRRGRAKL